MRHKNRYRDRTEIVSQILEVANGNDTKKLNIMYRANLSYAQLKGYLTVLSKIDLLRYDLNTQTFKTTEKGLRFLDICNKMGQMMTTQT